MISDLIALVTKPEDVIVIMSALAAFATAYTVISP